MKVFTPADLRQLMEVRSNICVSLYLPSSPLGPQKNRVMLQLKNLIKKAESELLDKGMRPRILAELLKPVRRLLNDAAFWEQQSTGLAIFLTEQDFYYYRLPADFHELLYIDERFYLKPLLSLLTASGRYFILALSLKEIRVFEANRFSIIRLRIADLPEGMDQMLAARRTEKFLHATARNKRRRESIDHGQGPTGDDFKKEIEAFFKRVDQAVCRALDHQRVPLVLAGVDHIVGAYLRISKYHHLLDATLPGSPEHYREDELHQWSLPLIKQQFEKQEDQAIEQYFRFHNDQKSTADPETILTFGYQGEVDTLFLRQDSALWGLISPDGGRIETHRSPQATDKDLLDEAAFQTLSHNGRVFVLPPGKMPQQALMAANLRLRCS